ncbi:MAG: CDP-glucose 4,6-dehydratase [Flavobacteriaceae bacterium]|jgi:CDP-glucose 4,6-dehydratase|nr:CDP-glucose 4,6-dehydratase [Flavobacteriaceae bacterium]
MFLKQFKNKKVLITGHTGFKGSWLSAWLIKIGADVIGVSKDIPTNPSLFESLELEKKIKHYQFDLISLEKIRDVIKQEEPDYIFHLAAQALVSVSYENPLETIMSNTIGTTNLLESLRDYNKDLVIVLVTSDKSYDNVEWPWGYKETDKLGGKDIYSGSKAATEIIFRSFFESFLIKKKNIRIGVARAGNVIGGGDWAKDRIIPDCLRSWSKGESVNIRSPKATRPWQHVLEPLSGYLLLAIKLKENLKINGEAFNFGPTADLNKPVLSLIQDLYKSWQSKESEYYKITGGLAFNEAQLLKLNCDKAQFYLNWAPSLNYKNTIDLVGQWYSCFYNNKNSILSETFDQISFFEKKINY